MDLYPKSAQVEEEGGNIGLDVVKTQHARECRQIGDGFRKRMEIKVGTCPLNGGS